MSNQKSNEEYRRQQQNEFDKSRTNKPAALSAENLDSKPESFEHSDYEEVPMAGVRLSRENLSQEHLIDSRSCGHQSPRPLSSLPNVDREVHTAKARTPVEEIPK
ncbi:hypothetical protein M3Y98_00946800 [Aphelenchoides besseyi]|nr:hypothetical protein M3Y98_00946800 [Aphelenchoides besseyi]KAI6194534.1 hypothetical protein M3Y96_01135100 [Aphelenchoides besseyi]